MSAASIAAYVALGWGAFLLWMAIGALIKRAGLQRRHFARPRADLTGHAVLLVRPCAGAEPGLLDNLLSVARMPTRAELRVVMSIDDPADPARAVIEEALPQLRAAGVRAELAVIPPTGPNRKASMLAALHRDSDDELFANVDSNVDLEDFPFDELLAPLVAPDSRFGAIWGPWMEMQSYPGVGPRASAAVLGASLTSWSLLCGFYGQGLVGKIWAARRQALEEIEAHELSSYLGEDLEMANRMMRCGWKVGPVPVLGRARGGPADFGGVVARFGRWMLAARGQRPELMPTYPLLFFGTPLVLALAAVGVFARPQLAGIAALLAVSARLLVTLTAQYWAKRPMGIGRALVDAVLGDLALGIGWIRGMSSREVQWRGHTLRVGRDGRLLDDHVRHEAGTPASPRASV